MPEDLFNLPAADIDQMIQDLPEMEDKDTSKSFDKLLNLTWDF